MKVVDEHQCGGNKLKRGGIQKLPIKFFIVQ